VTKAQPPNPSAVVLVDHGSREPAANEQLEALAKAVRRRLPGRSVRVAHLEIEAPSLEEALQACVAEGAQEIVVHPYFLAPGRHASSDIPRHAEAFAAHHPGLRICVTEPLGVHDGLVQAVVERVTAGDRRSRGR